MKTIDVTIVRIYVMESEHLLNGVIDQTGTYCFLGS